MKKRILSMLLAVVMVMAVIPASLIPVFAKAADGYENGYDVYISHDDPIFDGKKDAMYDNSEKIVNTYHHTSGDKSYDQVNFEAYALITAKGFYLYADVKDSSVKDNVEKEKGYGLPKSGDKLAIFMQLANYQYPIGSLSADAENPVEWVWGYFDMDYALDNVSHSGDFNLGSNNGKAVKKSSITDDGWTVEFFFSWQNCTNGKITKTITPQTISVYFGIQANNYGEADGSKYGIAYDTKACESYWHTKANVAATSDPTNYYEIINNTPSKTMVHAKLIQPKGAMGYYDGYDSAVVSPTQIEIDGELDSVYLASEKIYNNYQFHKANDFYAYTAVSQNGIYFWVRIFDESVDVEHENSWGEAKWGDKLQIDLQIENGDQFAWGFFDLDYSDHPISKRYNFSTNKCAVQYKTKTVYGGWIAEVYVPWDSTSIVDTSDFSKISAYVGFQVNNYGGKENLNYGQAYDHPNGANYYQEDYYGRPGKSKYTKVNFDYTGAKEYDSYGANFPGFPVYSHNEDITIDAKRDEVYLKSDKITERRVVGTYSGFDAYISVTSEGIYVYNEIQDSTIGYEYMKYNTQANSVGNHDKFQFYFTYDGKTKNHIELDYFANNVDGFTYTQGDGLKTLNHISVSGVTLSNTADDGGAEYATKVLYDKNGNAYAWVAEIFIPWKAATTFASASTSAPYACKVGLQVNNVTWGYKEDGVTIDKIDSHASYSNYSRFNWYNGADNSGGDRYWVPLTYSTYVAPTTSMYVTSESIVLDGKLDDVYLNSQKILSRSQLRTNQADVDFIAYPIATSDGLYLWTKVDDTTMNNIDDSMAEQGDVIQIYLDWTEAYRSHEVTGKTGADYKDTDSFFYGGWFAFDYEGNISATNDIASQKSGAKSSIVKYLNPNWNGDDPKTQYIGYAIEAFIPWNDTMKNLIGAHRDDIHMGIGIQVSDDESYNWGDSQNYANDYDKQFNGGYRTSISYDTDEGINYHRNYECLPNVNFIYDEALPMFGNNIGDIVDSVKVDGLNTNGEYDGASIFHVNLHGGGTADDGDIYRVVATEDAIYVLMEVIDNTPSTTSKMVGQWYDYIDMAFSFNGRFATMSTFRRSEGGPSFSAYNSDTTRWFNPTSLSYKANETIACTNSSDKWTYEIMIPLTDKDKEDIANGTFFFTLGTQYLDSFDTNSNHKDDERNYKYSINSNGGVYQGDANSPSEIIKYNKVTFADMGGKTTTALLGTSVTLSDSININYYASVAANDVANVKIKFTFNGKETWVGPKKTENDGIYIFPFEDIAPQCMGDNIKAELYVGAELVDSKDGYSILQNVINIMTSEAHPEYKTTYKDIVSALLKYGAAAQKYTNYKTGKLVTEYPDLSGLDLNFTNSAPQPSVNDLTNKGSVPSAKFSAVGVYFANTNKIYVKIQTTTPDNLTVKINGMEAEIKPYDDLNNIYIVYSKDIKVTEFDKVFTFVLSDASGNTQTLTYSVNQYTANMWNSSNAKTQELARATYDYGKAAKALKELKESM